MYEPYYTTYISPAFGSKVKQKISRHRTQQYQEKKITKNQVLLKQNKIKTKNFKRQIEAKKVHIRFKIWDYS